MSDVRDLSDDEILTLIEDAFDASISPSSMVRGNNNKLHLIFKADKEGYKWINKAVLALSQRFQPALCGEGDLVDSAKMVGTSALPGKQSQIAITVANTDTAASHTLLAGNYKYTSVGGEDFTFTLPTDVVFSASQVITFWAISTDIGSFPVLDISVASVSEVSGIAIDGELTFSCANNELALGYDAETTLELRQRLLSQVSGDDVVTEIQNAILRLPSIFECTCLFNASVGSVVYDGITLAPMELLICITGTPTQDLAAAVATRCAYITHNVSDDQVEHYDSPVYIGGFFPVYYMYHGSTPYTVDVSFIYDSTKIQESQAQAGLSALLDPMRATNRRSDQITARTFFEMLTDDILSASSLPSVSVVGISLSGGSGPVPYISVPLTRIAQLSSIAFSGTDIGGE